MARKEESRRAILWSPEAEQDLFAIFEYVWQSATAAVAEKVLRGIHSYCYALGGFAELGKARDDVRRGLRSVRVSRYVIFYRVTKTAIEIVRVLDERRDVDVIFPEE